MHKDWLEVIICWIPLTGIVIKFWGTRAIEFEAENTKSEYYLLSPPQENRANQLFTIYRATGDFKYMVVNNKATGSSAFNTETVHKGTCYRKGKLKI